MVATDIREQRLRIQLRPAAGGDLGIVDETRSTQPRRNGDEVSLGPKAEQPRRSLVERPRRGRGPRACASFGRACATRRACDTSG